MVRIGAPGTGFSSRDTSKAVETLPGLASRRRSSGGGSSGRVSTPTVSINGGTVMINGQGFSVAPSLQAAFIQKQTGGVGSSAANAIAQARKIEAQRLAQQKAVAEAKAKLDKALADQEFKRVLAARARIIARGAKEKVYMSTAANSGSNQNKGDKLKVTVWMDKGNKIIRTENLSQGIVTYNRYAAGAGGGSVRFQGGVIRGATPTSKEAASVLANKVKITKSNTPGKVLVTFPNGQKVLMGTSGRGVVGKELAGHTYVFEKGKIVSVDGKWSDGRDIYEPTVLTVEAVEQPTGFIKKNIKKLNDMQKVASTSSIRNRQTDIINELTLLGLTVATTVVAGVAAFVALPKTILSLIRNPSQIKRIPGAISRGGQSFGQLIRVSPTEALGVLAGEALLFKGSGMTFKAVGKVSTKIKNIIRPVLNKIDKTRFTVNGNTIKLAGGTSSTAESLTKQVARAGKPAVGVSAQANKLVNVYNRFKGKIIRKPIPGENLLSSRTKSLLKKFDAGKITGNDLVKLDKMIKIETKGAGSLLERSFYADPAGRIRASRLGIGQQKEASLLDILSGDYTLRANKPQILIFDDIVVQKLPTSLKKVAGKLKAGKTLTQSEMNSLLKFQLQKSGKFKPIGAITRESEITLAPGEIIKKVKTIGYVSVNGRRVPVVRATVIKSTGELKTLLGKLNKNTISGAELKKLERLLNSKTGFKTSLTRSGNSRPVANFPGIIGARGASRLSRVSRRVVSRAKISRVSRVSRKTKRTTTRKKAVTRKTKTTKRTTRKTPKKKRIPRTTKRAKRKTPRTTTKRRVTRPPKRPGKPRPPVVPKKLPKGFKRKTLSKPKETYYVVEKVRGKFKKLYSKPLTAKDAKDYAVYSIDNRLSKTAFFVPLGKAKKIIRPPKNIQNYFSRNSRKVRPYKIRYGKKKQLLNGFIEKRKYFQDTKGERLQMAKLRRKTTIKKKRVKRKITSQQRKILIKRLIKARAAKRRK